MQNYCGNKDPFVFLACAPCDHDEAARLAAALGETAKVYLAAAFGKRERRALEKAALVLPVLSAASLGAMEEVTAFAAAKDKALLPVFLEKLELPAGLRLLLGGTQRHLRTDFETREDFERALCAAPALSALTVSPQQKRAAKTAMFAAVGGFAAAALLALLLILQPFSASRISRRSALGQLGLSGDPTKITSVALYGSELEKRFEDGGVYEAYVSVVNNPEVGGLYLPKADKIVKIGTLSDLSDFTQLVNLEELSLAGNSVEDVTPLFTLKKLKKLDLSLQTLYLVDPYRREIDGLQLSLEGIGALENLEALYLCYDRWPADGSVPAWMAELDGLPHFRTLVLDRAAEVVPALLAQEHRYEIVLLGREARDFAELREAAADPDCHAVYLPQGTELVIPAGEEWTLPKNVMLGGAGLTIRVEGTLRVRGWVECGMTRTENRGAVVVEKGGSFIGGMSDVYNEGLFTVEEGGLHLIERGMEFWQRSGRYVNNGRLVVGWGGTYHLEGGEAENNGEIVIEYTDPAAGGMPMPDNWLENKVAAFERFTGGGRVEYVEVGNW